MQNEFLQNLLKKKEKQRENINKKDIVSHKFNCYTIPIKIKVVKETVQSHYFLQINYYILKSTELILR